MDCTGSVAAFARRAVDDAKKLLAVCLTVRREFDQRRIACGAGSQLDSDEATYRLIVRDLNDAVDCVRRSEDRLEVAQWNLRRADERQRNQEAAAAKAREAPRPPAQKSRRRNRRLLPKLDTFSRFDLASRRTGYFNYFSPFSAEISDRSTVIAPSLCDEMTTCKARREIRLRSRGSKRKSKASRAAVSQVWSFAEVAARGVQRTANQRDAAQRDGACHSGQSIVEAALAKTAAIAAPSRLAASQASRLAASRACVPVSSSIPSRAFRTPLPNPRPTHRAGVKTEPGAGSELLGRPRIACARHSLVCSRPHVSAA